MAEAALKAQDKALRAVQEKLAEAREGKARGEARLEAARERRSEMAHTIREQLECAPEECLAKADLKAGAITWTTYAGAGAGANPNPIDYGSETVLYFKLGTGTGWSSMVGYLDAVE